MEIDLDLSGDQHGCYKNENDNLKLISSSTPPCAVPIKLCRSDFADLFIFWSVMNALMHTSHLDICTRQPLAGSKPQEKPKCQYDCKD